MMREEGPPRPASFRVHLTRTETHDDLYDRRFKTPVIVHDWRWSTPEEEATIPEKKG